MVANVVGATAITEMPRYNILAITSNRCDPLGPVQNGQGGSKGKDGGQQGVLRSGRYISNQRFVFSMCFPEVRQPCFSTLLSNEEKYLQASHLNTGGFVCKTMSVHTGRHTCKKYMSA